MKSCADCRHWRSNKDRDDFRSAVQYWDPSPQRDFDAEDAQTDAADKLYGICDRIDMETAVPLGDPPPLATVRDGSDYMATLYTRAEFGCVLHEQEAP